MKRKQVQARQRVGKRRTCQMYWLGWSFKDLLPAGFDMESGEEGLHVWFGHDLKHWEVDAVDEKLTEWAQRFAAMLQGQQNQDPTTWSGHIFELEHDAIQHTTSLRIVFPKIDETHDVKIVNTQEDIAPWKVLVTTKESQVQESINENTIS